MTQRLLTPSKITAWLDCSHYLTLRHRVDAGDLELSGSRFGSFAELLAAKGVQHEEACLANYREQGLTVFEVPQRAERERFTDWVERIGNPTSDGHDVIYQMPFIHDGVRGIAGLPAVQVDGQARLSGYGGRCRLARTRPSQVMPQLCFCADAIDRDRTFPRGLHLWLDRGAGTISTERRRPGAVCVSQPPGGDRETRTIRNRTEACATSGDV